MKRVVGFGLAMAVASVAGLMSFGGHAPTPAGERLAISFPIWALYDMGPGGNFADPDRAMDELKARGFNALRFDDGAGFYSSTNGVSRGKVRLHPPFGPFTPKIRQMCVVSKPCEIDVRTNLVRLRRAGLWGAVARTPSGPEDPSWNSRADDYRRINEAFRH